MSEIKKNEVRSNDDIIFKILAKRTNFEVSSLGLELYASSLRLGVFDEVSVWPRNFKQVSVWKVTVSTTSLVKPTQWLGQCGPNTFELRAVLRKRDVATLGPLLIKWYRLWKNRFTSFELNVQVHRLELHL